MRAYKLTRKRSSYERCSLRIGVLRNFAKSQENTCARVSFLIKLHAEVYGIKFKTLNRLRSIDYYFKNYPLFVITYTGATFFLHLLCEHLFFTCVVWKHFKKRKWILTFIHRTTRTFYTTATSSECSPATSSECATASWRTRRKEKQKR